MQGISLKARKYLLCCLTMHSMCCKDFRSFNMSKNCGTVRCYVGSRENLIERKWTINHDNMQVGHWLLTVNST